jgi:hypothetical protein
MIRSGVSGDEVRADKRRQRVTSDRRGQSTPVSDITCFTSEVFLGLVCSPFHSHGVRLADGDDEMRCDECKTTSGWFMCACTVTHQNPVFQSAAINYSDKPRCIPRSLYRALGNGATTLLRGVIVGVEQVGRLATALAEINR